MGLLIVWFNLISLFVTEPIWIEKKKVESKDIQK